MQGVLDAHVMPLNDVRQQIADIRYAQRCIETTVAGVQKELPLVEEKAPPPAP